MSKSMKNFKFIFTVLVIVLGISSNALAEWNYNGAPVDYVVVANQRPVVDAGPDYALITPTSSQSITGTATDPDGTIVSTNWYSRGGPTTATIVSPNSLTTNITGMTVAGTYLFRLAATDNQGASSFDQMQITVSTSGATGWLTVSPNSCVISIGASTCTVTGATWNTVGASAPRLEDGNTGSLLSTLANNATALQVWVAYPSTNFQLKDGTFLIDSKTATSSCASGSSWNGSICEANSTATSVTLTASPMSLFSGNSSTLSWTSSNVTSCTASASPASGTWTGPKATSSSFPHESSGALTTTTIFRLACTGAYGDAFDQKTVTVLTAGPGITVDLTATPEKIASGEISTLSWISSGATSCSGIGFTAGALNGSIDVSPTRNTTYTINCVNGSLSASDQASVTLRKKFLFIEF